MIVFPSRFLAQQLARRRPAGLGISAPPGWLGSQPLLFIHSAAPTPGQDEQAGEIPGSASARGVPSRSASAAGLLWGPAGRREEPNFSLSLFFFFFFPEARPTPPLLARALGCGFGQFQDAGRAGLADPDRQPSLRTSGYRSPQDSCEPCGGSPGQGTEGRLRTASSLLGPPA